MTPHVSRVRCNQLDPSFTLRVAAFPLCDRAMESLSNSENLALGGVTAVIVGMTLQPTLYWKNAAQQGKPFTMNPRVVYRGLAAALTAEAGQMGLQYLLTGFIKKMVVGFVGGATVAAAGSGTNLTPVQEMSSALIGGAISAIYTTPVELTMIQQQNFGGSLPSTAARLVKEHGVGILRRGFLATAMRDGVYTLGLLGMVPVIQRALQKRTPTMGDSTAGFIASAVGGTVCGIISCPLDAMKTCMQGDVTCLRSGVSPAAAAPEATAAAGHGHGAPMPKFNDGHTHKTLSSTFHALRHRNLLFGGVGWRVVNISGTLVIANELRLRLAPLMFPGAAVPSGGFKH